MIAVMFASVLSLNDVVRAAVEHAPSVAQARAAVRERSALLNAARGGGVPHGFASYAESPQAGNTNNSVEQKLTTAGLQLTLGDFAGRSAAVAGAQADLRSAQQVELGAERTERISAIGMYFEAMKTAQTRALREEIVRAAEADRRAARLRYAAGDAPHVDVLRADVELAQAQADLASARADETNARHALEVEVGSPVTLATAWPSVENACNGTVIPSTREAGCRGTAPTMSESKVLNFALTHRPEVLAAQADVTSEESAVRAAQRAVLPGITAQAGWTNGNDVDVPIHGPTINVTADIPLSHANSARVEAERARLAQAQARLDAQNRTVDVEVSAALQTLNADNEALAAATRARDEARAEVNATLTGYREGASSSLDVDSARRAYAQAAVAQIAALAAQRKDAATLNALVGMEP